MEDDVAAYRMLRAWLPGLVYTLTAVDPRTQGEALNDPKSVTVRLAIFAWEYEPRLRIALSPRLQPID
jgi:hypothetical protein